MLNYFLTLDNVEYLRRLKFQKYLISSSSKVVFSRYVEDSLGVGKKGIILGAFALKFFQEKNFKKYQWIGILKFLFTLRRLRRSSFFLVTRGIPLAFNVLNNFNYLKLDCFYFEKSFRIYSRTASYYSFFGLIVNVFNFMKNRARLLLLTAIGRVLIFYKNYYFFRRFDFFSKVKRH